MPVYQNYVYCETVTVFLKKKKMWVVSWCKDIVGGCQRIAICSVWFLVCFCSFMCTLNWYIIYPRYPFFESMAISYIGFDISSIWYKNKQTKQYNCKSNTITHVHSTNNIGPHWMYRPKTWTWVDDRISIFEWTLTYYKL